MKVMTTLVLLLVLGTTAHSDGPAPGEAESKGQPQPHSTSPQQEEPKGTHEAPDPPVPKEHSAIDEVRPHTNAQERNHNSSADWWIVGLTATMIIVLIAHGVAYWRQWGVLRDTLNHNRESSERQLRAYLSVTKITINQRILDPITIEIEIQNDGQTPAYEVVAWNVVAVQSLPPTLPFYTPKREYPVSKTIVGPGGIMHRKAMLPASEIGGENRANFEAGRTAIYVWGKVEYKDAFGASRFTRFCDYCTYIDFMFGQTTAYENGNEAT